MKTATRYLAAVILTIIFGCTNSKELNQTVTSIEINKMESNINTNFTGSLSQYDITNHVELLFKDFFNKHGISKAPNNYYKNNYSELFIGGSDHRYIDLAFRRLGDEKWYNLNFYLEVKLGPNDVSSWAKHSHKYTYSNIDELANAFVKFYSNIATNYLNEPFENNFSWKENYDKLQSDLDLRLEIMKRYPAESVLNKMYFDRSVREEWRVLANEKLGLKN